MNKEILSQIIQNTGLSKSDFAKAIGEDKSRVSQWLSGYRNIRENRLQEILTQFKLKISFKIVSH